VIALIDYGAGNLTSVRKALSALEADFTTPRSADELANCAGIIVPGVGHFGATQAIGDAWRAAIRAAIDRGAALLGICLGMQWLFESSDEAPSLRGLGVFAGNCVHLGSGLDNRQASFAAPTQNAPDSTSVPAPGDLRPRRRPSPDLRLQLKVPHVGWNRLDLPRSSAVMAGIAPNAQVYFTHSYAAPVVDEAAALTTYGMLFSAAVERGRIAGVQFHPEKSGDVGLRVLKNFLEETSAKETKLASSKPG
jgi:glutamine amidotransferase